MIPIIGIPLGCAMCAVATVYDLRTGLIPNRLTVSMAAAGVILGGIWGGMYGIGQVVLHLLAAALVPLALFRLRAMGGGDVKLFAALGALGGISWTMETQMLSFGLGSLYGLGLWIHRGVLFRKGVVLLRMLRLCRATSRSDGCDIQSTEIRFAPFVLVSVLVTTMLRLILSSGFAVGGAG